MSDTHVKPWSRGQDWVSLVGGGLLALTPLWFEIGTGATWAMVIIGLAVVGLALVALAMPGAYVDEWMTAAAGAVAFVAPWVFSYSGDAGAAWTSWIVGVVVAGAAVSAVPESRHIHEMQHHAA